MSQQTVGLVIDRLLTDEYLRIQFALDPVETIADLYLQGFELTRREVDVLVQANPLVWFCVNLRLEGRAH